MTVHHYPWHPGDYALATRHLSLIEDLAYRRILDLYYSAEKKPPSDIDRVARLIMMPEHAEAVGQVLREFFIQTDEGWMQRRAEREITKYHGFGEAGRRGAESRWPGRNKTPPEHPLNTPFPDGVTQLEPEPELEPELEPLKPKPHVVTDVTTSVPYQKIVDLYHQILPNNPQCKKLSQKRRGQIAARWREELPDLQIWQKYFEHVRKSKFLTGKCEPAPGRQRFCATLEWLTNESNFLKTWENLYHGH